MAEKILQTRIINKNGLLTDWNSSKLPLKEGEIALAKVMIKQPDGSEAPSYVMKVGVEGATFSASPWLFAKASDVYSWAKAESKPVYNAGEIVRGTSNVNADLTKVEQDIVTINAALGADGTVAEKIKAAIEALDVEDAAVANQFVTAVSETDGKISVTRRALDAADIPTLEIAKINGLTAALAEKAVASDVNQKFTTIETAIGDKNDTHTEETVYGAIAAAKKIADDHIADKENPHEVTATQVGLGNVENKSTATIKSEFTGSVAEGDTGFVTGGAVKSAIDTAAGNAETAAKNHADAAVSTLKNDTVDPLVARVGMTDTADGTLSKRIATLESNVNNLNAATTFAGTGTYAEMQALTGIKAGSIFVVVDKTTDGQQYDNKEFVYDGSKWVELGDTTAELARISAVEGRATVLETKTAGFTGTIKDAVDAVSVRAEKGITDAASAQGDATEALNKLAVVQGADTQEGSIAKAVKDAKAEVVGDSDDTASDVTVYGAKAAAKAADDKAVKAQSDIDDHKDATNPHNITAETVGLEKVENKSVAEIKTELGKDAAVADGNAAFVSGGIVYTAIEAAKTAAAQTAQDKVDTLANGAVKTNTDNITNIKSDLDNNVVKVKTTDSKNQLVYGAADDVIIFDCGGPEA